MAPRQLGWGIWVSLLAVLWTLQPLLISQARGIVIMALLTGGCALLGIVSGVQLCVVWSAVLGVLNLTLALLITSHPTNLWVGLSAGLLLLGLLDGQQGLAYLRYCQVEPGVPTALLRAFMRLSGWSLAAGLGVSALVVQLAQQGVAATTAGYMTIAGAGLFVGFFAAFLFVTSRWVALKTPDAAAEKPD